jgi:ribosomal protein S25
MCLVYGGKCLSHKVVHNWVEKFSQEHSKVADDAQPDHPVEAVTEATVQRVEEFIQTDRRITMNNVATALGCSHSLACSIMHDYLKFQKVCTVGVQRTKRSRKNEPNMSALAASLTDEGEGMLNRIVTEAESSVHYYQPKSKHASLQWKHQVHLQPKS